MIAQQQPGWMDFLKGPMMGAIPGALIGAMMNKKSRGKGALMGGLMGMGFGRSLMPNVLSLAPQMQRPAIQPMAQQQASSMQGGY